MGAPSPLVSVCLFANKERSMFVFCSFARCDSMRSSVECCGVGAACGASSVVSSHRIFSKAMASDHSAAQAEQGAGTSYPSRRSWRSSAVWAGTHWPGKYTRRTRLRRTSTQRMPSQATLSMR